VTIPERLRDIEEKLSRAQVHVDTSPKPDEHGRVRLPVHKLVSEDVHDELLAIQPFTLLSEMPKFQFLSVLNRLSIQDKHRSAILAVHLVQGVHKADVPTPLPITYEVGDITLSEDGIAEAELVAVGVADGYVDSLLTLTVAVCFIDEEWKPILLPLAQSMVTDGRTGIARFERFFC